VAISTGIPTGAGSILRLSTDELPERDRLGTWREIFGLTVVKLDIEPLPARRFYSQNTICPLPGLGLLFGACSAVRLVHASELIVDDDLSFMAGRIGPWTASQLGRNPVLGSGDGVLMWNAEVGSMTLPSDGPFVTFRVPVAAIAPLVPDIGAVVARRIPADCSALRLLVRYLEVLDAQSSATPELQHLAATHVHDLLAVALGATREASELANGRGVRAAQLRAIKADVVEHLGRHRLSVTEVAARHRVSPRYVQMLFEGEGTTFTQFVLSRRLARAHRMLTNPHFLHRPIGAIAFDVGFGELSYFDRTFRRHFGNTPSQVRHAAMRDGGGGGKSVDSLTAGSISERFQS
jgi:AraC-like DNA-binding protein